MLAADFFFFLRVGLYNQLCKLIVRHFYHPKSMLPSSAIAHSYSCQDNSSTFSIRLLLIPNVSEMQNMWSKKLPGFFHAANS